MPQVRLCLSSLLYPGLPCLFIWSTPPWKLQRRHTPHDQHRLQQRQSQLRSIDANCTVDNIDHPRAFMRQINFELRLLTASVHGSSDGNSISNSPLVHSKRYTVRPHNSAPYITIAFDFNFSPPLAYVTDHSVFINRHHMFCQMKTSATKK